MKQLLILSGKGGTGKTTIASAFISLSKAKAYADCDVDAPNLHLIMQHKNEAKNSDYYGLPKAEIDTELCIQCDLCRANCRFDAIYYDEYYVVDDFACEGCGVCKELCPTDAISLRPTVVGDLILYDQDVVFSTAKLKMGSGNSGKLVSEVKQQLQDSVEDCEIAIIDGSPGIGCPVIASLSGVDMVLIVTEPSVSGISDMERIIKTAQQFQTKVAVCINKYDTNTVNTKKIQAFCKENNLPFVGSIPYDVDAVKAINQGKTIIDVDCTAGQAIIPIYNQTMNLLLRYQ